MNKKFSFYMILLILFCSLFSSCSKETKIDRYEFSLRLEKSDAAYSINPENVIIENEKQHIFFSLQSEDDCLLTLHTDRNDRIERITLGIDKESWNESDFARSFIPFFKTVIASFCIEGNIIADNLIDIFTLDDSSTHFIDSFKRVEIDSYEFILFSSEKSMNIECGIMTKTVQTSSP